MRHDQLYLADILQAAAAIDRFLEGITKDAFLDDELRQSAVLQKLIMIGEAAARLSPELKSRHPEIEWSDIIAFRNIAVHAYFTVDWSIVWYTAKHDVPLLAAQIGAIMDSWQD